MTTQIVNTHEAKSRLSELIREVERGVDVIVARNGHPVARIVPWQPNRPAREPGVWAGQVTYDADVVASDEDIVRLFEESADAELP